MGSRGPQPTPTEHLAARGSWRAGDRPNEPADAVEAPECPLWIKGEARREWFRIVPALLKRRTLSVADHGILAGMCFWWGQFVDAQAKLQKLTSKRFSGFTVDHPRVLLSQAWKEYSATAQQFGLSPASKSRVQATPEEKKPADKPKATSLRIAE